MAEEARVAVPGDTEMVKTETCALALADVAATLVAVTVWLPVEEGAV